MSKDLISIVSPFYGNKELVNLLYNRVVEQLSRMDVDYEMVFVNDACPYGSGEEIEKLALKDKRVKLVDLSRNFGQHYAIKAGLDYANGDWVIVMDCDLQDNPEDIPRFYAKAKEGYDIVIGIRKKRKEGLLKKLYSNIAHKLSEILSEYSIKPGQGNFSIVSKKVLEELKKCNEQNFIYVSIITWLGFKTGTIDIEQEKRAGGKSGYNFIKGLKLFFYLLISNSNKPLIFAAFCAFLMFILSFVFVIKLIFDYYALGHRLLGWTSLMTSLFFIGGLLFAYLSILGLYIGQIAKGTRKRPLYAVRQTINL